MGKTFLFRVDASVIIGTGHVLRCLTLADLLQKEGAQVFFLCKDLEGHLGSFIKERGYEIFYINALEKDAEKKISIIQSIDVEWIIVDHYGIDKDWELEVRPYVKHILVIDDLANRKHDCDILLDQNYYKSYQTRYNMLVPDPTLKLLGPSNMLLRDEFYELKPKVKQDKIERLLVFYGGSDPTDETSKALKALESFKKVFKVDVVVGSSNPRKIQIREKCKELEFDYHCQIDYLAELMNQADLSLGAGGVTMWERCFLGLPSVVTIVAENQRESTEAAVDYGAVWNLGWHEGVKVSHIVDILDRVMKRPKELREMSTRAQELMGNRNKQAKHPVVKAIMEVSDS